MRGLTAPVMVLVALCCITTVADAAVGEQPMPPAARAQHPLISHYHAVNEPTVQLSNRTAVRPGRTALTVSYSEPQVSPHMPMIVPAKQGVIYNVADTWQALKNLAYMFDRLKPINAARAAAELPFFPEARVALRAASEAGVTDLGLPGVKAYIDDVEAIGRRRAWSKNNAANLMLWPFNQPNAAVADLMEVSYNEAANTITLEVDVVHNPVLMTEFENHAPQTLDVVAAHYHYDTYPEVNIDAPAVLQSLKASDFKLQGLHVIQKSYYPACWYVDIIASPPSPVPIGSQVNVTITNLRFDCVVCNQFAASYCTGVSGNYTVTEDCVGVTVKVEGPAWVNAVSQPKERRQASSQSFYPQNVEAHTVSGQAWVLLGIGGEGPTAVSIELVTSPISGPGYVFEPNAISITGTPAAPGFPPVAKLLLSPSKAYRHVHDPVTLVAKALDVNDEPVANASVTVASYGDCETYRDSNMASSITDAAGCATFSLVTMQPGAVAVVAAAVNDQGVPVISKPANIIFFVDREYVDHREPDYYAPPHRHERDAESYAKVATEQAVQQLGITGMSV